MVTQKYFTSRRSSVIGECPNFLCSNTRHRYAIVIRFAITDRIVTIIEIHFIVSYCSHTQALFRHGKSIRSYRWLGLLLQMAFPNPVKPPMFITEPVGPLRCINNTALGAKLLPALRLGWTYSLGLLWLVHITY